MKTGDSEPSFSHSSEVLKACSGYVRSWRPNGDSQTAPSLEGRRQPSRQEVQDKDLSGDIFRESYRHREGEFGPECVCIGGWVGGLKKV